MKCQYPTSNKTQCIYTVLYIQRVVHLLSQKRLSHSTWLLLPVMIIEEGIKTFSAFPTLFGVCF